MALESMGGQLRRFAPGTGLPADLSRWMSERNEIYQDIMKRGWNPTVGAFTQHNETQVLDASLLRMPLTV